MAVPLATDAQALPEWKDWYIEKPPRDTWVQVKYSLSENWQIVKTCKRGCCVHSLMGTLVLPNFWKLATKEESDAEAAEWEMVSKLPPIDPWTLYSRTDTGTAAKPEVEIE